MPAVTDHPIPANITHYYEAREGPFHSLSDLEMARAELVLEEIRRQGQRFASKRPADYLANRLAVEKQVRALFTARGGRPRRAHPHYFILGESSWLKSWYIEGKCIQISITDLAPECVSFTYGDSYPAMRFKDGKPYRGKVYTFAELPSLVEQYGLPQEWNPEGDLGPERYIEAQVWYDEIIQRYREATP